MVDNPRLAAALAVVKGAVMPMQGRPSLRIARFTITNFRTFQTPTVIEFTSTAKVDPVAVFHGDNGSGKSNALMALELFFRGAIFWLQKKSPQQNELTIPWGTTDSKSGFLVRVADWPTGSRAPVVLEVAFESRAIGPLRLTLAPAGSDVIVSLDSAHPTEGGQPAGVFAPVDASAIGVLRNYLETPTGPGTTPLYRLDARRRESRCGEPREVDDWVWGSPLSLKLTERLLELYSSLDIRDTERWRAFSAALLGVRTLADAEVRIIRLSNSSAPELRLEWRGRQILPHQDLSSGEQQMIALFAAVLTSRASIVVLEEPEISLSDASQARMSKWLRDQVDAGVLDQVIIESHSPRFDGPNVIRFRREAMAATVVTRETAVGDDELALKARDHGAHDQYVGREGYTKLPDDMVRELHLEQGGLIWFFPSEGDRRWQAWTTDEVNELFGFSGAPADARK